jgi:hypothetical protein
MKRHPMSVMLTLQLLLVGCESKPLPEASPVTPLGGEAKATGVPRPAEPAVNQPAVDKLPQPVPEAQAVSEGEDERIARELAEEKRINNALNMAPQTEVEFYPIKDWKIVARRTYTRPAFIYLVALRGQEERRIQTASDLYQIAPPTTVQQAQAFSDFVTEHQLSSGNRLCLEPKHFRANRRLTAAPVMSSLLEQTNKLLDKTKTKTKAKAKAKAKTEIEPEPIKIEKSETFARAEADGTFTVQRSVACYAKNERNDKDQLLLRRESFGGKEGYSVEDVRILAEAKNALFRPY